MQVPRSGFRLLSVLSLNGKNMNWLPYAAMAAGLMALFFMGIGYLWVKTDKDDPPADDN